MNCFNMNGQEKIVNLKKICVRCNIIYDLDNFINTDGQMYIYPNYINTSHIKLTKNICYDKLLLKSFDIHMVRSGITFDGYSVYFNRFYEPKDMFMDRKSLADAYFSYKIKSLFYFSDKPLLNFRPKDSEEFLEKQIENFKTQFSRFWSRKHDNNCTIVNCKSAGNYNVT